jgi:hypothetical protein
LSAFQDCPKSPSQEHVKAFTPHKTECRGPAALIGRLARPLLKAEGRAPKINWSSNVSATQTRITHNMPGDFYVREKYVPTWRRRAKPIDRVLRFLSNVSRWILLVFCIGCAVCVLWPPETSYAEPISFQIARGNPFALGIMITLMGLLIGSIPMLAYRKRIISVGICVAGVIGLMLICKTNPNSSFHLMTFIWTCFALLGWLAALGVMEGDPILLGAAFVAWLGMLTCLGAMGIGERIVILSALMGIRGLFWGYILEE